MFLITMDRGVCIVSAVSPTLTPVVKPLPASASNESYCLLAGYHFSAQPPWSSTCLRIIEHITRHLFPSGRCALEQGLSLCVVYDATL